MAHWPVRIKGLWLILAALLLLALAGPAAAAPQTPVTLELKAADIRDVLQLLARIGEVNIVADQSVQGEVTVSLKDVPFPEALKYVAFTGGYAFRIDGNTVLFGSPERLAPKEPKPVEKPVEPKERKEEETTGVFDVRFADPEQVKSGLALVIDPAKVYADQRGHRLVVRGTRSQLDQVKKLIAELDRPDSAPPAAATAEPQETEVFALKYANPEEVRSALAGLVPADWVKIEKRTGNLIVTGTKSELAEARSLVERLDQGVAQIFIEARLEEISDEGLLDFGLKWPAEVSIDPQESIRTQYLQASDWALQLRALESAGKAKLLANPKVLAVDGEEARIHIGDSIPVEVFEIQDGVRVAKISFIDTGIMLRVTPKINGAGVITAKIVPEVSNVTGWATNGYPQIRKRDAETVLRMQDGQTVAIGGLRMEQQTKRREGVPGLSRIPLVGELFKVTRTETRTSELVIFITAKVVREGDSSPVGPVLLDEAGAANAPAEPAAQ